MTKDSVTVWLSKLSELYNRSTHLRRRTAIIIRDIDTSADYQFFVNFLGCLSFLEVNFDNFNRFSDDLFNSNNLFVDKMIRWEKVCYVFMCELAREHLKHKKVGHKRMFIPDEMLNVAYLPLTKTLSAAEVAC